MKVSVLTLGCRVNQSESAVIEGSLRENGLTIVDLKENPDICIINTCTVTAKSDFNSRQLIRRAARTGSKVIVTGCYSHLKKDEVRNITGVTEIVDNNRKYEIVNILTGSEKELVYSDSIRSRPHLKVQEGCNCTCSYCSVPLARGKSRSVPFKEVLKRAYQIEKAGYNELVITGVNLGSYGKDLPGKISIQQLIKKLLKVTLFKRIRLSSIEINEVDDELIELFQDSRLCKHIHLPLQSGSDKVLRSMRRNYTRDEFSSKIQRLSSRVDNISIGTDIIVGFPGEETDDFEITHNFLDSMPFSYLHIFPFSSRPNTVASKMTKRPDNNTIKRRIDILTNLNKNKKRSYFKKQLGRVVDVVIEEKDIGGATIGTSGNYIKIMMPHGNARKGSVVFTRLVSVLDHHIEGFIIP